MVKDWIRYESIELDKNGYYVTYQPIFTGEKLAVLIISLYEEMNTSEAISTLEYEFNYWITKYPTPLMVMLSSETKFKIDIEKIKGNSYILGYPGAEGKNIMKWEAVPDVSDHYRPSIFFQHVL